MGKEPKSIRAIRAMRKAGPQLVQGIKQTMLIHGNKTSQPVLKFLRDIRSLRRDRSIYYSKKHELQPFEDKTILENFCKKANTSLFLFGSHSKKRPNNIVIGRMYDEKVLDMVEMGIKSITAINEFNESPDLAYHVRPFLIFQGDLWETDETFKKMRNLLNDFFFENDKMEGIEIDHILKVVVSFTIFEDRTILMKTYECKVEGKDILEDDGKLTIQQLGPNVELCVRRSSFADADQWRKATHIPKPKKKKQNKNIRYDEMGNKKGKLYVDRQNLKNVPSRKRKLISKGVKAERLVEKKENEFGV